MLLSLGFLLSAASEPLIAWVLAGVLGSFGMAILLLPQVFGPLHRTLPRVLSISSLGLALLVIGMSVWFSSGSAWPERFSQELPTRHCAEYCEARPTCWEASLDPTHAQLAWSVWRREMPAVVQSQNAWSSLVFAAVALLVISARPMTRFAGVKARLPDPLSFSLFASCIWLAFGSFFFHAGMTARHQAHDVSAVYLVLFVLLAHGIERWLVPFLPWLRGWLGLGLALMLGLLALRGSDLRELGGSTSVFVLAALLIFALSAAHYVAAGFQEDLVRHGVVHEVTSLVAPTVILLTATALRHQDTVQANGGSEVALTTIAFGLTLLVLVAELTARLTRSVQKPWRWAWTGGAGCLAIAVFPWYSGSINAPSCSAGGWFNGHQWWHILVAVALYLQWRFFDHHALDRSLPRAL